MTWFGARWFGARTRSTPGAVAPEAKAPAKQDPSAAFAVGTTPAPVDNKQAPAGAVANFALRDDAPEVITSMNRFPLWKSVLSGPAEKGALQVPVSLQDKLIAVVLTSGHVLLAYEASSLGEVKLRLASMRAELEGKSLAVERQYAAVSVEVLREVRTAAESKARSSNSDAVRSESINLFKDWVLEAKGLGATDLHFSFGAGNRGFVQVRVDGVLEELPDSRLGLTDSTVLSVIKAAYEGLADRHSNSEGSFSERETRSCMIESSLGISNLRLRFTSQRGFFGPKAVMRLLTTEVDNKPMAFEAMGFAPSHLALLDKAQRLTAGIILQIGVTGSGKTTAEKTFLETHPRNGQISIYQVADPVEYVLKGVHQINVQRSLLTLNEPGKKDPYSEVIESLMRMDPDIVDVGEIRDSISARAAANVAKTGHLVLGTLHADSIEGTITRLTDPKIGLTREELTAARLLRMLTYQALVPVLCKCAMDAQGIQAFVGAQGNFKEQRYLQYIATQFTGLGLDAQRLRYRNPQGCAICRHRGTKGLTIVAEMLLADDDTWLDLCAAGKDRAAWRYYRETYSDGDLLSPNMDGKTVMEHAIFKAMKGEIDPTHIESFGALDRYEPVRKNTAPTS